MRVFIPLTQPTSRYYSEEKPWYQGNVLAIRFAKPPSSAQLRAIRAIADRLPPSPFGGRPVVEQPMTTLAPELAPWRLAAGLFSVFGFVTLLLAGVGLYGLVGYEAVSRMREFGVRIALGAQGRDIVGQVVGSSLRIAGIAVGAGLVAAVVAVRAITSLLFNTSPADPVVLTLVVVTLLVVAVTASVLPAWRATRSGSRRRP